MIYSEVKPWHTEGYKILARVFIYLYCTHASEDAIQIVIEAGKSIRVDCI